METIEQWAEAMAQTDREACALDEDLSMDAEWTGEHTTALADHLGVTVDELSAEQIDAATRAYMRAACA